MFREVPPFNYFLTGFWLFGFEFKAAHVAHKFMVLLVVGLVAMDVSLIFLSLVQSQDIDDLTTRLLYVPTILGIIMKGVKFFIQYDKFKKIFEEFSELFDDKDFKPFLDKAAKKALFLAKFQFYQITVTCLMAVAMPIATHMLTIPMFVIPLPKWQEELFWFSSFLQDLGSFYNSYMWIVIDCMPICLMIVIAEYFNYLNEGFKQQTSRSEFIKFIKLHQRHIQ